MPKSIIAATAVVLRPLSISVDVPTRCHGGAQMACDAVCSSWLGTSGGGGGVSADEDQMLTEPDE